MTDVRVTDLGDDLYLIDAMMEDEPHRLACYLFDTPERVLIECGPSRSIEHLFRALDHVGVDDLAVMAVTHIHIDHAGGAGHFARRYPNARIGVHTKGARHLVSPDRLWDSACRVFGEQELLDSWGPMEPIDEDRVLVLDEGDRIPLGGGRFVDVMYTPGHAKHHLVYHEASSGAAFVGDAVGLAFPHGHMTVQPGTPPPDFDPDLLVDSLHRIGEREPSFLGFAHFGPATDPQSTLAEAEERVRSWVSWVEASDLEGNALADALRDWVLGEYRRQGYSEEVIGAYDRSAQWGSQTAGILRWMALRG
jgi:glyoxylase-like metal-dependent hydrolase (beta-lactamase superfamily II)